MFAIGIKKKPQPKLKKPVYLSCKRPREGLTPDYKGTNFIVPYSSWLILPYEMYTIYDRIVFDFPSTTGFTQPYTRVMGFRLTHPEKKSVACAIANVLHPMPYNQIQNQLLRTFYMNQKLRWLFKRLLLSWKAKRFTTVNEVDIITMEVPKQPVRIREWATKKIYVFEASSLLKDAVMRLTQNDELFMEPLYPRNLLTNTDFPYAAMSTLTHGFRTYGMTHWVWEAFVSCNYQVIPFLERYEVSLKFYGLDEILSTGTTYAARDFLIDFISQEYDYHNTLKIPDAVLHTFLEKNWSFRPVRLWIGLCKEEWQNRIRIHSFTQAAVHKIHLRSKNLINANLLCTF